MELKKYLSTRGRQSALAAATGLSPAFIWQMANGLKSVPVAHCVAIEVATGGEVSRKDLRPNDWHRVWPDLEMAVQS
jgi:DNA-binding transcriptional regulator YdaS (Cro superfamily)